MQGQNYAINAAQVTLIWSTVQPSTTNPLFSLLVNALVKLTVKKSKGMNGTGRLKLKCYSEAQVATASSRYKLHLATSDIFPFLQKQSVNV